ncbi:unnamed protein product [Urochloa humidicola]
MLPEIRSWPQHRRVATHRASRPSRIRGIWPKAQRTGRNTKFGRGTAAAAVLATLSPASRCCSSSPLGQKQGPVVSTVP